MSEVIKRLAQLRYFDTEGLYKLVFDMASIDGEVFIKAFDGPRWQEQVKKLWNKDSRNLIECIKFVRSETNMGLSEAKKWCEANIDGFKLY